MSGGTGQVTINIGKKSGIGYGGMWHLSDTPRKKGSKGRLVFTNVGSGPNNLKAAPNIHTEKGYHFSNNQWTFIVAARRTWEQQVKLREIMSLKSTGHTRKSWLDMCADIGVTTTLMDSVSPQKAGSVSKYLSKTDYKGKSHKNGSSSHEETSLPILGPVKFRYVLTNTHPSIIKLGGDKQLSAAIAQREKAFAWSMRKGVFKDLQTVQSRYPMIFKIA